MIRFMRHSIAILAAAVLSTTMYAQMPQRALPFFSREDAPHLENILPPPPGLTDPLFFNDWAMYNWGKSIRETDRGALAVEDAHIGAGSFMKRFSEVLTCEVTPENSPALYRLLERAHRTTDTVGRSAKTYFSRVRPYQQYKEPSGVPQSERPTDFTSYPSGHTHAAWVAGMIFTAIDPVNTEPIMKIAYEMGQSRVIVGFHYQSDVDAGRIAGSVTFARLCAEPEFLTMLQEAKDEFNALCGNNR